MVKKTKTQTKKTQGARRGFKKRNARYARYPNRSIVTVNPGDTMLAPRCQTKLTYTDVFGLTSTSGLIANLPYFANSLYDPFTPIGGHQPRFFDEMSAIYNRYRVYGVEVLVEGQLSTPGALAIIAIGHKTSGESAHTSMQTMMEAKMPYRLINDDDKFRLKKYYPIHQIFGVGKDRVALDDVFSAPVGGNPSWQANIYVQLQHVDLSSTVYAQGTITLTYYCQFDLPRTIGSS